MNRILTLPNSALRASAAVIATLALTSLAACSSTHESTILITSERSAHVLVTGSNPSIELHADPEAPVQVTWYFHLTPEWTQTLGGYLARNMRGGGALILTSDQPASVRVICKGATGFGITQPAKVTPHSRTQQ